MKFTIAQFQDTTGLPLTADFVVNVLGIKPDEQIKRSMLWERDKYGLILGRLQNYINGLGALDPTSAEKKVRVKPAEGSQQSTGGTAADDPFADDSTASTQEGTGSAADDPFAEESAEENLW